MAISERVWDYLPLSANSISGIYLAFGIFWILLSDRYVALVTETQAEFVRLQTLKGWAFVGFSTLFLFALLRSYEATISEEQEFTNHALDSLDDLFLLLGDDGEVQRVNEHATEVTGYDEHELRQQGILHNVVPEDRDMVNAAIAEAYETGSATVTVTLQTHDGSRIAYEFRGHRIIDSSETLQGLAIIGRDISNQLLTEERLRVALRILRHDLLNKLSIIQGWAQSLSDDQAREVILNASDRLLRLSHQSRQMAQTGNGKPVTIDVTTHVTELVAEYQDAHPDVSFETAFSDSGDQIGIQSGMLDIALENVIGNSIEHNDGDSPWVRIDVTSSSDRVQIKVADNGPGIPDAELSVLDHGETQLEHGSGIGLWLAKWSITEVGGTITYDDRTPTGTVVTIDIPNSPPDLTNQIPASTAPSQRTA